MSYTKFVMAISVLLCLANCAAAVIGFHLNITSIMQDPPAWQANAMIMITVLLVLGVEWVQSGIYSVSVVLIGFITAIFAPVTYVEMGMAGTAPWILAGAPYFFFLAAIGLRDKIRGLPSLLARTLSEQFGR